MKLNALVIVLFFVITSGRGEDDFIHSDTVVIGNPIEDIQAKADNQVKFISPQSITESESWSPARKLAEWILSKMQETPTTEVPKYIVRVKTYKNKKSETNKNNGNRRKNSKKPNRKKHHKEDSNEESNQSDENRSIKRSRPSKYRYDDDEDDDEEYDYDDNIDSREEYLDKKKPFRTEQRPTKRPKKKNPVQKVTDIPETSQNDEKPDKDIDSNKNESPQIFQLVFPNDGSSQFPVLMPINTIPSKPTAIQQLPLSPPAPQRPITIFPTPINSNTGSFSNFLYPIHFLGQTLQSFRPQNIWQLLPILTPPQNNGRKDFENDVAENITSLNSSKNDEDDFSSVTMTSSNQPFEEESVQIVENFEDDNEERSFRGENDSEGFLPYQKVYVIKSGRNLKLEDPMDVKPTNSDLQIMDDVVDEDSEIKSDKTEDLGTEVKVNTPLKVVVT